MILTPEEQSLLAGNHGHAAQTAMQILAALGKIYEAKRTLAVRSVQIAGVSYDNLGEAGLDWLTEMADGGGTVRVPTTLNPAGMDLENWQALGIPADFAEKQLRVIDAFTRMGVTPTCTCTPYLAGNLPAAGDTLAWAESSAVCYANSVIGARTNREGGPSALAAALTGRTPEYGMHLDENRRPGVTVEVSARLSDTSDFGALGKIIGERLEAAGRKVIPWINGVGAPTLEQLKSLCASVATYGGLAMFYIPGVTPEAAGLVPPREVLPRYGGRPAIRKSFTHRRRRRRGGFLLARLPAPDPAGGGADRRTPAREAGGEGILDHHLAPGQARSGPPGIFGDHPAQRGQVRGGYLLRRRPDPRAVPRNGDRQRQGVLLRRVEEQI